jgi:pilus assembly protein CpaB
MYTARIVVLTIALSAGGVAAYLASGSDNKSLQTEPVVQLRTADVLVARSDIGLGQSVAPEDLQSRTWPTATASNSFIRRNERPDATTQVAGSIARAPFIAGEPIRENISDHHAPKRGESVNVVRYGVSTLATTQN